MPKKLLVFSDAPGSTTGLGGQAQLLVEAGISAGCNVVAVGFTTTTSRPYPPPKGRTATGTPIYLLPYFPTMGELLHVILEEEPDVILGLADFWQLACLHHLPERYWKRMLLWLTADCEFYDASLEPFLTKIGAVVALAKYGEKVWSPLRAAGGRLEMIPHAVKKQLTIPVDPETTASNREALGLTDKFVALHIGRNQMRKMTPNLIDGWARFVRTLTAEERSKAVLYLHTEEQPAPSAPMIDPVLAAHAGLQLGWDLKRVIEKHFADVKETIKFSERGAPDAQLREVYALCDVFVMTSSGEGFGVPIIEAQACGRPVISADNTTTPELVGDSDSYISGNDTEVWLPEQKGTNVSAPFGFRVECSGKTMQPDILEWRPVIDSDFLSDAFRSAHDEWLRGKLNNSEITSIRRDWTLARFGWDDVRAKWVSLIKEVVGGDKARDTTARDTTAREEPASGSRHNTT